MRDVVESDATFAIVNGTPPDEGVMVELGAAIALGKKTFLFRDDFRRCTDSEDYPLNLMLFTGLPEDSWQDYYYTALDEIAAPDKALARWLQGTLH
jgi:nucleoside 2-deoxyribosyltransferase